MREQFEIGLKNSFLNFWPIFGIRRVTWLSESIEGDVCASGTNWRNSPSRPREIWLSSQFFSIFPPVPSRDWTLQPPSKFLFRIGHENGSLFKKFSCDHLKLFLLAFVKITVFSYVFCKVMKSTWSLNIYHGEKTKDIQSTLRFLRHSKMPLILFKMSPS